jgi:type IV pilus assembly protein PilM
LVLAQSRPRSDDQVVAFVDVGAVATKVMVMRGDQLVYSREQAFGGSQLTQDIMRAYGMSSEEAEAVKRSGAGPENYEPELLRPFVENLALEVSRALQFFFSSPSSTRFITSCWAAAVRLFPASTRLSRPAPRSRR